MDKDLYELPEDELKYTNSMCLIREATESLRVWILTGGNVFTEDQIEAYIDLKMEEVVNFEHSPPC